MLHTTSNIFKAFIAHEGMERLDGVDGETLEDDQKDDSTVISTEDGSDTRPRDIDLDAVLWEMSTIDEDVGDDDDEALRTMLRLAVARCTTCRTWIQTSKLLSLVHGVGKTTLLHVLSGYPFDETTTPATIGIDFFTLIT